MKYFRSAADWQQHFAHLLKEKSMAFPNPNCTCEKCKGHFAAAARANPPNPYHRPNRALAANDLTPDLDPKYQPRGIAPNGYRIALAARKANQ